MRPEEKLEKEVRFLKAYAVAATACFALLFLTAFQAAPQKQRFTEVDVERINVVQPDGKLALVIDLQSSADARADPQGQGNTAQARCGRHHLFQQRGDGVRRPGPYRQGVGAGL